MIKGLKITDYDEKKGTFNVQLFIPEVDYLFKKEDLKKVFRTFKGNVKNGKIEIEDEISKDKMTIHTKNKGGFFSKAMLAAVIAAAAFNFANAGNLDNNIVKNIHQAVTIENVSQIKTFYDNTVTKAELQQAQAGEIIITQRGTEVKNLVGRYGEVTSYITGEAQNMINNIVDEMSKMTGKEFGGIKFPDKINVKVIPVDLSKEKDMTAPVSGAYSPNDNTIYIKIDKNLTDSNFEKMGPAGQQVIKEMVKETFVHEAAHLVSHANGMGPAPEVMAVQIQTDMSSLNDYQIRTGMADYSKAFPDSAHAIAGHIASHVKSDVTRMQKIIDGIDKDASKMGKNEKMLLEALKSYFKDKIEKERLFDDSRYVFSRMSNPDMGAPLKMFTQFSKDRMIDAIGGKSLFASSTDYMAQTKQGFDDKDMVLLEAYDAGNAHFGHGLTNADLMGLKYHVQYSSGDFVQKYGTHGYQELNKLIDKTIEEKVGEKIKNGARVIDIANDKLNGFWGLNAENKKILEQADNMSYSQIYKEIKTYDDPNAKKYSTPSFIPGMGF